MGKKSTRTMRSYDSMGGLPKDLRSTLGRTTYRLANFDHFAFHEENVGGNMKSSSDSNSNDDDDEGEESEDNNNINNKNDNNNNIEIAVLQHVTGLDAPTKYGQLCEKRVLLQASALQPSLHPEFHYFVLNTVAQAVLPTGSTAPSLPTKCMPAHNPLRVPKKLERHESEIPLL